MSGSILVRRVPARSIRRTTLALSLVATIAFSALGCLSHPVAGDRGTGQEKGASATMDATKPKDIPTRVKREGERIWIEGVPNESLVYSWDMPLRGLHLLLRHRGEAISLDELSALSGDAFHICFATGTDTYPELIAPMDPLANAAEALGYRHQWLITESGLRAHLSKTIPDEAKRRSLTLEVLGKVQVCRGRQDEKYEHEDAKFGATKWGGGGTELGRGGGRGGERCQLETRGCGGGEVGRGGRGDRG